MKIAIKEGEFRDYFSRQQKSYIDINGCRFSGWLTTSSPISSAFSWALPGRPCWVSSKFSTLIWVSLWDTLCLLVIPSMLQTAVEIKFSYSILAWQLYLWVCAVSLYRDLLEVEQNPHKPTRTTVWSASNHRNHKSSSSAVAAKERKE